MQETPGSFPGLGRSPGGGHGNPFQYSCLENSVSRGAWILPAWWKQPPNNSGTFFFHTRQRLPSKVAYKWTILIFPLSIFSVLMVFFFRLCSDVLSCSYLGNYCKTTQVLQIPEAKMGIITEGGYQGTVISSPDRSLGFLNTDSANKSAESLWNSSALSSLFLKLNNVLIISLPCILFPQILFKERKL